MSEPTEQPAEQPSEQPADADPRAWEEACAEDLAAERARFRERTRQQPPPRDAAEELRKLMTAITEEAGRLGARFGADAALLAARARSTVNAEVLEHLSNAGAELVAAYRAAVVGYQRQAGQDRPAGREDGSGEGTGDGSGGYREGRERTGKDGDGEEPSGPAQRIDLD
ncbi:carbon catabolit repression protein [Streptomyces cheonanensis]|uniref:Carbon catabolit repression protein n=1 Tax=Streptomyces cheonanensis TaxID=312720 RepID=A0ABN2UTT6_9ACTN|nr:DUF5304 family protein [Streptomyces sp. AA0539]